MSRRQTVKRIALAFLCPALFAGILRADEQPRGRRPLHPVHTYSIVARDLATGELGVAVQSHWFSVGTAVPWAEAGVGAVATQSFVETSYGPLGLELMRAGRSAPDALRGLLAADDGREVRQVAMIDAQGRVAAHTGRKCIAAAGNLVGANYSVQANLMDKPTVWPAMAQAFESAAILVVSGKPTGRAWVDRKVDLRVEDSADPLGELKRLVHVRRAYQHMDAGRRLLDAEGLGLCRSRIRRGRKTHARADGGGVLARGDAGDWRAGGRGVAAIQESLCTRAQVGGAGGPAAGRGAAPQ